MPERIAVISDTHGVLPDALVEAVAPAQEIWHLGDVTQADTLQPLRALGKPLLVVQGNCDPCGAWPDFLLLERHGIRFRLQHHPPRGPVFGVDALLYGHLHQPFEETENGVRLLNPGAVSGPRGGSYASFAWIAFPSPGQWTWTSQRL